MDDMPQVGQWLSAAIAARWAVAGSGHTCALLTVGAVKCWGLNSSGQLGNGTTENSLVPLGIGEFATHPVTSLTAGGLHSCAVMAADDHPAMCWGGNRYGQLGNNSTADSSTPAAVAGIKNIISLDAGVNHTCAVIKGGTVKCWGAGNAGQLGSVRPPWKLHSVALTPAPPTLTAVPPKATNKTDVRIAFSLTEGIGSCSLDSSDFTACAGAVSYSSLTEGLHSVTVRATNEDGFTSDTVVGWLVDTTRPSLAKAPRVTRSKGRTQYSLSPNSDATKITMIEWSPALTRPDIDAPAEPHRAKAYAPSVTVFTALRIRWIRIQDAAGNWSPWYAG